MWPANIYLVMWLTDWPTDRLTELPKVRQTNGPTDQPTDGPTDWQMADRLTNRLNDWQTNQTTDCMWKKGKSLYLLIIKMWIILFAHTDHVSFVLLSSYTVVGWFLVHTFLTLHFLISSTVCIYGLISLGLAFVVSKLGMILQVCTGTLLFR